MQLVQETVSIPKEMKEIKDCLVSLATDIHQGKSISEVSADILPKLFMAVEGYQSLGEEAKSPEASVALGLMGGQIGAAFLTPKAVVVVAPVQA
jgi:hypothetical protein